MECCENKSEQYQYICDIFKSGDVELAVKKVNIYGFYEFLLDTNGGTCFGRNTVGYKLSKLCITIMESKND